MRVLLGVFLMLIVWGSFSERSQGAEQKYSTISLLTVGNVDSALRDRVVSYVKEQYGVAPGIREPINKAPGTLEALKQVLVKHVQPEDACLLALCDIPAIEHEGMVFKEERCGAINVSALTPGKDVLDRDEVLGRRVEKESLRAVALMVGMPPCPFPRCALKAHGNDQELDFKSRNPCPPCLEKIRVRLQKMGLVHEAAAGSGMND